MAGGWLDTRPPTLKRVLPARKYLYGGTEQEGRAKLIEALAADARGAAESTPFGSTPRAGCRPPTSGRRLWSATASCSSLTSGLPSGGFRWTGLEPQHLEALLRSKRTAGLSSKTCNHIRTTLRTCLNDALRQGIVARNVAALARPIQQDDRRESVILTPDQVGSLIRIAHGHPDGPLWLVALATGARQSELLGLPWSDVDLEARVIRISKTLQRTPRAFREQHGEWIEQATKTRRSTRTVPLAGIAWMELRRLREELTVSAPRALVFCRADGRPISGNHLSRSSQRALADVDVPPIRFHDLRHATAAFLAIQRIPVAVTMAVLGHSNASTTLDIYTRVAPELAREAAKAMDRVMVEPARGQGQDPHSRNGGGRGGRSELSPGR